MTNRKLAGEFGISGSPSLSAARSVQITKTPGGIHDRQNEVL